MGKLYRFTVEGRNVFPFDMLRHDQCWPASNVPGGSTNIVNLAPSERGSIWLEQRQVVLCGITEPNERRWESFGWKVVNVEKPQKLA